MMQVCYLIMFTCQINIAWAPILMHSISLDTIPLKLNTSGQRQLPLYWMAMYTVPIKTGLQNNPNKIEIMKFEMRKFGRNWMELYPAIRSISIKLRQQPDLQLLFQNGMEVTASRPSEVSFKPVIPLNQVLYNIWETLLAIHLA